MKSCRSIGLHSCATLQQYVLPLSRMNSTPEIETSVDQLSSRAFLHSTWLGSFCSWIVFAMQMPSQYPPWTTTPLALTRTSANALLACGFPMLMSSPQNMPGLHELPHSLTRPKSLCEDCSVRLHCSTEHVCPACPCLRFVTFS